MLYVKKQACIGCGLCARSCPRGAIVIIFGKEHINDSKGLKMQGRRYNLEKFYYC